jgi:hypothetical protein
VAKWWERPRAVVDLVGTAVTVKLMLGWLGVSIVLGVGGHLVGLHGYWVWLAAVGLGLLGTAAYIGHLERHGLIMHGHTRRHLARQNRIVHRCHAEYVATHSDAPPGVVAGTDPIPKEWMEQRLTELGEPWRYTEYRLDP